MLKALRRKINSDIAGITACGCCSIGAVIIASVFLVFVAPEYQMINSFQQDSCMMYDCGGEMLCRNSQNLSVFAKLLILILLCCALAGSCVERRAPGVCSWSTLANTDHCTLYYNVSVLRVGFLHARLLFYILNYFPQYQRRLPLLQPRVASTLMILEPSLKKETSLKVLIL
jgi:hypothetical protein